MILVDSSVWLEIIFNGKLAARCEQALKAKQIYISSLTQFEVFRKVKKDISEEFALECLAHLNGYTVIDINREVAIAAAELSQAHGLSMADSMILASAHSVNTELLTLDHDFHGLANVKLLK